MHIFFMISVMFSLLLLMFLLTETEAARHAVQCGTAPSRVMARIEGGVFAGSNDFPWMVSIQGTQGDRFEHHCGGTLITSQVVLTAAHCRPWYENVSKRDGLLRVVIGCNNHHSSSSRCHVQEFSIDEWINHEDYYHHWRNNEHDIAVIRLSKNVTRDQGAALVPICMPLPDMDDYYGPCTIAGWGFDASFLEIAEVQSLHPKKCSNYNSLFEKKNMICAGDEMGIRDACHGDSGGPLMVRRYTTFHQIGIVNAGKGCANKGWHGIYTKVSRYIRWIEKHTYGFGQLLFVPKSGPTPPYLPGQGRRTDRRQLPVSQ